MEKKIYFMDNSLNDSYKTLLTLSEAAEQLMGLNHYEIVYVDSERGFEDERKNLFESTKKDVRKTLQEIRLKETRMTYFPVDLARDNSLTLLERLRMVYPDVGEIFFVNIALGEKEPLKKLQEGMTLQSHNLINAVGPERCIPFACKLELGDSYQEVVEQWLKVANFYGIGYDEVYKRQTALNGELSHKLMDDIEFANNPEEEKQYIY